VIEANCFVTYCTEGVTSERNRQRQVRVQSGRGFGGSNPDGDGSGHGHVRATTEGQVTIQRGSYTPGVPFARQDATEFDSRNFDDRGYYNS